MSGLAALMLERNPALKPEEVRAISMKTARDLRPPGGDDQFGAGEADAVAPVTEVTNTLTAPLAVVSDVPAAAMAFDGPGAFATRDSSEPPSTMASGKPTMGEVGRPAAQ